jgi:Glyoxalase-like domain
MTPRITRALSLAVILTASASLPHAGTAQAPLLELDHIYFVVSPGGDSSIATLRRAGILVDTGVARHDGQGTASVAAFFENAYLELLWVDSSVTVDSMHRLDAADFARASAWRHSGATPIGVGLHLLRGTARDLGIPFRLDSADRLGPGMSYVLLRQPEESLAVDMFIVPDNRAVTSWLTRYMTRHPEVFDHPMGARRVTGVLIRGRPNQRPRAADLGPRLVQFREASSPLVEVEFDGGRRGQTWDLRPILPLILRD